MDWKCLAALLALGCSGAPSVGDVEPPDGGVVAVRTPDVVPVDTDAPVLQPAPDAGSTDTDAVAPPAEMRECALRTADEASCSEDSPDLYACQGGCPESCEETFGLCCCPSASTAPDAGAGDAESEDAAPVDDAARPDAGSDSDCEARVYFQDSDGDGFGDPEAAVESCDRPDGYVDNDEDCYDESDRVSPKASGWSPEELQRDRGDGRFDRNCDGEETKMRTAVAECNDPVPTEPHAVPECGQSGQWVSFGAHSCPPLKSLSECNYGRTGWGICGQGTRETVTQACY